MKKHFDSKAVEEMLLTFESMIELIQVKSKVQVCRDTKDDFLLSLSKDGKAHFLITGDKDLLSLNRFRKTDIVTFSQFIKVLEGATAPIFD